MTAPATTPTPLALMPSKPRTGRPGRPALHSPAAGTTYRIDDNVPLPQRTNRATGPQFAYPFRQLRRAGQSFLVPFPATTRTLSERRGFIHHVSAAASYAARKLPGGRKFACRTVLGGVRVWRVK